MTGKDTDPIAVMENPAQTMRDVMTDLGKTVALEPPGSMVDLSEPWLVAVPDGRTVQDLTSHRRAAAEYFKPLRRKGTARLANLDSLIGWANRFKGDSSVLYANPDQAKPTLTCIADYHGAGAVDATDAEAGDPTASHCQHRGVYDFPVSKEWLAWTAVSDKPLDKDDMGEFIEAHARDIQDPTPALLAIKPGEKNEEWEHEDWENRLIATAQQIGGRYGQLHQLLQMSRQFQVYETSHLTVTSNRDTGEQSIQFLNEHKDREGAPLSIPNLIIIAIPVFEGGARFRMPVRFRYRKVGGSIKFILSTYDPQRAFDTAFDEAVKSAATETGLPLFIGKPEE